MGKNKVKLQFIENEKSRKATYIRRAKGILRKTEELSALCGIDACCVIYGPYDKAPMVWPSCGEEAKRILTNFKLKSEIKNQSQRQIDQAAFLKDCVAKANDKLLKIRRKNREMEMENIITEVIKGRMTIEQVQHSDLGDLLYVLEDKLKGIEYRLTKTKGVPPMVANNNVDVSFANENGGGNVSPTNEIGCGNLSGCGASTSQMI